MVKLGLAVLAVAVGLVTAPKANAATAIYFNCTDSTVCSAGPSLQQTVSQSPTFTVSTVSADGLDTAVYSVAAIPNNVAAPLFTVTSSSGVASSSESASLVGAFSGGFGGGFRALGVTPEALLPIGPNEDLIRAPEPGTFAQLLLGLGVLACGVFLTRTRMGVRGH